MRISRAKRNETARQRRLLRLILSLAAILVFSGVIFKGRAAQLQPGHETLYYGSVSVRNYGLAETAPLRIRFIARAGRDVAGVHRQPLQETNLLTISMSGLQTNRLSSTNFSVTCPASNSTNIWAVFAVLEEQFGGGWAVIDFEFVGYGDLPENDSPILSWGPARPLPPAFAPSEENRVIAHDLEGPPFITDGSTNQFFFLVLLSGPTNGLRSQTLGTWKASLPAGATLTSSGVFSLASLPFSSTLTITGSFDLGSKPMPTATPLCAR